MTSTVSHAEAPADGLSGAIVTGEGVADHLPALAMLAIWSAVGIVLAVRGFSWDARRA